MSLKKSRFVKGIILAPDSVPLDGIEGEIKVDSSTGKIQVTLKDGVNPSASREIVTSSQTQTLTNKTLTSPVLDTGVSGSAIDIDGTLAANSDTKLASQKAVKTYVDAAVASKDQASEISYSNATSGLTATNVQTAIDEVDGNVDNLVTLSGVALDSTTLGTFTGTTIPDSSTIKSAIQSLETSHESHTGASSGVHGVAGSVVGTSDSQALTNKTIDADLNTISNIENADIKVGAAIARAKLASGTANRIVINDATGVQTDASAITASRALISDANGIPTHSSTTSTEIGHLSGVTSAIQTQLDGKVDESGGTLTSGSVITPARLDVKQGTKASLTTYALTATNGQIVYATDTKEMFQVIDGLLEGIGGGEGVGGTDILFAQTFETAALTDFTQTGLSLSTSSPLHGEISALLTHQAGTSPANDRLFKQVIPVDNKFRNQTMVLRLDVKSNASAGNVVIKIYDETNAANIVASEQLQLSNDVNGTKNSVGFTIPETCASLSYTITALPEAGSPVTRIDDIICELAETALLETAVEVPVVTAWQGYTPTFQGFGTPSAVEFEWRQVGENVEIRGKFTSGNSTAVEARVGLPAGLTSAGTSLIPSLQFSAFVARGTTANPASKSLSLLIEPSVTYFTMSNIRTDIAVSPLVKQNGFDLTVLNDIISFFASVPCSGLSATTTKTIPLTQSGLVQEADSYLQMSNATSSANVIDFSTTVSSMGSAISKQGNTFVIQESGIYNIGTVLNFAGIDARVHITKNSTSTTNTDASVLAWGATQNTGGYDAKANWSGYLIAGDIIRLTTAAGLSASNSNQKLFISYQGSLKQIVVSSDQKLRIPTSELRFEGASSRGSTATVIVKFDTIAKLRGDAFTVESDSVLGTRITMKKAGLLNVNASCAVTTGSSYLMITKNLTSLTVTPSVPSEIISASQVYATTAVTNVTGNLYVNVGDIIRIAATGVPAGDTRNVLNLSFQEQDISVSVTNTLPQFSESDSSVRVDTANGYGSTGTRIRRFSNVRDNIGTDIAYNDGSQGIPAQVGDYFVVKSAGIYNISYSDVNASAGSFDFGISRNASNLTTNIVSLPIAEVLAVASNSATLNNANASWQGFLSAGDVIRAHADADGSSGTFATFTISKVGKPNVTGVDVTPFVNVPQPVSQSSYINSSTSFGLATFTGALSSINGQGVFSYNSSTGIYTALKNCSLTLTLNGATTTGTPQLSIVVNSVEVAVGNPAAGNWGECSWTGSILSGSTFFFRNNNANTVIAWKASVLATALSDQILTAPETFSTDTASLTYAGSGAYTLSTLANAPVGTFITFTYAANTNTRTQTTTAPTQTTADMNANGILLYTRAFNAASSAGQPAAIAIQIGKGLKGKSLDLYKSAGKVTSGELDFYTVGTTQDVGAMVKSYNEATGILIIDVGLTSQGTITSHQFLWNDNTAQVSGYLVINASKNPALTGMNVERVSARGMNTAGTSYDNSGAVLVYDATKTFDTHGALNTSTGVFTCPESGFYQVNSRVNFASAVYVIGQAIQLIAYRNGALISVLGITSAQTTSNVAMHIGGSDVIYLTKGDTLDIRVFNGRGATTLNASAGYNFTSITKTNIGGRN